MKVIFRGGVCTLLICLTMILDACSLIPQEEAFKTAAVVKDYKGDAFSMATVKRGDLRSFQNISCVYKESNTETVTLDEWVIIKNISVKVGDRVKAGDVLVTTMSDDVDSNIDEIKYEIKKRKLLIRQSKQMCELEIARQRALLDDEVSIRAIEENYDVKISGYKDELEYLRSSLKTAKDEQKNYQYTAGIDGVVTYVNENAVGFEYGINGDRRGGNVKRGNKIVTISDGSKPCFAAKKDSSEYVSRLSENQGITVSTITSQYEAVVHFSKDEPNMVYFQLDYIPNDISDGNIANAEYVLQERKNVLYLPESAVNKMGSSYIVYYEDKNGLKNAKEVKIGLIAENKVEIVSGLEFGDAVIVR